MALAASSEFTLVQNSLQNGKKVTGWQRGKRGRLRLQEACLLTKQLLPNPVDPQIHVFPSLFPF
jgi:hypothetical protein